MIFFSQSKLSVWIVAAYLLIIDVQPSSVQSSLTTRFLSIHPSIPGNISVKTSNILMISAVTFLVFKRMCMTSSSELNFLPVYKKDFLCGLNCHAFLDCSYVIENKVLLWLIFMTSNISIICWSEIVNVLSFLPIRCSYSWIQSIFFPYPAIKPLIFIRSLKKIKHK